MDYRNRAVDEAIGARTAVEITVDGPVSKDHNGLIYSDSDSMSSHPSAEEDYTAGGDSNGNNNKSLTNLHNEELRVQERRKLGRRESLAVVTLRVILFLVIFVAAALVSSMVYFYVAQDQNKDFVDSFERHAQRLISAFTEQLVTKLGVVDSLAVSIASFAAATNSVFPNVTVPDFSIRGSNMRVLSRGIRIEWLPLVTDETREGWQAYANENKNWLFKSYDEESYQRNLQDEKFGEEGNYTRYDSILRRSSNAMFDYSYEIFEFRREMNIAKVGKENAYLLGSNRVPRPEGSGPYLPTWQMTPTFPSEALLNFDVLRDENYAEDLRVTLQREMAVLGRSHELLDIHKRKDAIEFNSYLYLGQYRHHVDTYMGGPVSTLFYPVFDTFQRKTRKVVGVLITSIYWRSFFANKLAEDVKGILCVLENTLNQSFSYRVDGKKVTYLGPSDMHDSEFDDLGQSVDIMDHLLQHVGPPSWSYTQIELQHDYCGYTLHVYPSNDYQKMYVNQLPLIFSGFVAAVFAFMMLVFVIFDCLVERRQAVVMDSAVAKGALVASLFPDTVVDRLMQEDKAESATNLSDWIVGNGRHNSLLAILTTKDSGTENSTKGYESDRPIADHYPDTSILFADLAGFTSWSSSRKPEDIFRLLEEIYSAFDAIAMRRQVFKVETIGDCYVAVTGLPKPQSDHAVRLARFAQESMGKMNDVVSRLQDVLGKETLDLQMRVGIHSGPVTAGVLRGQKSRFQLFGDTMNTASRMESNGEKGRIQVSQATADLLIASGKSKWLTPREGKIVAKGKGEMQTYWVESRYDRTSSISC